MPTDFSRLQDLSNSLNKKSDELNESLKAFEAMIASFRLGVDAWVKPSLETRTDDHGIEYSTTLGYSKATGNWCLTIGYWSSFDEEGSYSPLNQASRELRIKAIEQLPKLLKALESAADEAVQGVEKARKNMRNIIDGARESV